MKSPRRKLFLFVSSLIAGGAERVALLLAREFSDQGHEVYVVVARSEGEFARAFQEVGQIIDLACAKPIKGIRKLAQAVEAYRPDACIAFGIHAGIAAALSQSICRWTPTLLVRNEGNLDAIWLAAKGVNKWAGPLLSRWVARKYGLVCVSRSLAQASARYLGVNESRIVTIMNPVYAGPLPVAQTVEVAKLHPWLVDAQQPVFVAMGRLEREKGFDLLLDALAIVRRTLDARLIVFGNGTLRQALEAQAQQLGLTGSVSFPGFTAFPMAQMRHATAFVLSSRFEGFGLVLVEALMSGTQVVATDCDFGPAEVLEGGRYGQLIPPEDAAALAEALLGSLEARRSSPPPSWFEQFSAAEAARRHIEWLDCQDVGE